MRKTLLFKVLIVVCLVAAIFSNAMVAYALGEDDPKKCQVDVAPGESIPSTFNVSKCLTTQDQVGSKFVPKRDLADGGTSPQLTLFLADAIDYFVKIIGSLSLVVFMIGGVLAMTSGGKEDQLEKGKTAMVYSLIGLAVALFSFILVAFVQSIFF